MPSLPVPFREDTFAHACTYGFPEDEYQLIRRDFPQVHVVYRTAVGQMEVWAVGTSGNPHGLMKLEPWQVPKLRSMLWDMHYEAMNTTPHEHAVEIKKDLDKKHEEAQHRAWEGMNPDAVNWTTRQQLDIHRPIQGMVPREYGEA